MAAVTPDIAAARRLVVKIGSALLVGPQGLRADWLRALCDDVADWRRRGADVVLVSSGSIALGRRVLGLPAGALMLEQATEQYKKITELEPADTDAWLMLGRLYKMGQKSVEAKQA